MLRDSRTKEGSAGVGFTSDEHQVWQEQVVNFFARPISESAGTAKKRQMIQSVTLPRLASLDWLLSVEHGMSWATGRNFKSFQTADPDEAEVKANGELDLPHPASASFGVPPLLTIVSDQQSAQLCSLAYCEYALRLNIVHWPDPFHISWKDICEACAKSGFQATVQASLVVYNIAYGPYQRAAFFNDLRGAASDVAVCMTPNDALLVKLWPAIMCDAGVADTDMGGEEQRAQWLRELPLQKFGDLKGPKASTSRWFSFLHSQRYWGDSWHCKLLLLVWVALRKGWASKEEDIFRHDTAAARQVVQKAMLALDSAPPAAARSNSGAASSSASCASAAPSSGPPAASGSGPPLVGRGASSASTPASPSALAQGDSAVAGAPEASAPASKAGAVAAGKQAVEAMRAGTANTLHAVARMLANGDMLSHIRLVALATKAFGKQHGATAHEMRAPEDNCRFHADWACWYPWALELFGCGSSVGLVLSSPCVWEIPGFLGGGQFGIGAERN